MKFKHLAVGGAMFLAPAAAIAQNAPPEAPAKHRIRSGNFLNVGVGAVYNPSYDGSDDMDVSVIPVVQGMVEGVAVVPRPAGLALDFIPDPEGRDIGFALGPVATISSNRANGIMDPVVRAAGKLDTAVELGVSGGTMIYGVRNRTDRISLAADVKWDVAGAHNGMTISPSVSYFTPVSRAAILTVSVSARHVDGDYARYYYSVTPEQGAASGLPLYGAKSGWDKASVGVLAAYDLSGNVRDGGFGLIGIASYSRMLGEGKRTPYTSLRGDPNQWMMAAGIGYTF